MVASFRHVGEGVVAHPGGEATDDDAMLHARRIGERLVHVSLERDHLPTPIAAVCRDEDLGVRVVHPVAQRLRRESAEHDAMDRADAGAGEHGDRRLGHERQVDADAIALSDPEPLQDVGELADFYVEVPIGQRAAIARLALPDDRGLVPRGTADVPVDAVGGDVQLTANKPLGVRWLPVQHRAPRGNPLETTRFGGPEGLAVAGRVVVRIA